MTEVERVRMNCHCNEDGCWIWKGWLNNCGNPTLFRTEKGRRRSLSARRHVYQQAKGCKLGRKEILAMTCDEKLCVNPDHMKRSNFSEMQIKLNRDDPSRAHRIAIKNRRGKKLTPEQARAIRESDEPSKVLAERYGVSCQTIRQIWRGISWKDYSNPFSQLFTGLIAANDSHRKAA